MKKALIIALVAIIACTCLFANGSAEQSTSQKSYSVNVASGFAP